MEVKTIKLPFRIKRAVLALGSQTKNAVCLAKDNYAYFSRIHPDLNQRSDFLNFDKAAKYFLKKNPEVIAYDLHPEYQSTKYALSLHTKYYLLPTQHHHAHIASCMAENNLNNKKVIGIAFDGTGLGDDADLWGAEFFICNYSRYERMAHLKYIPLIGAEKAIKQPWRVAILWLYLVYKDKLFNSGIDFVKKIDKREWSVLKKMYDAGFNCPLASSMGRLFDGVASLVLNKLKVNFEAEAAIELEKLASSYKAEGASYRFKIIKEKNTYILDVGPMFKEVTQDIMKKEPKEKIAYRFHYTIAEMIKRVCLLLRNKTRINEVVLSGGVFQNKVLLKLSSDLLYEEGLRVFTHKKLSPSDSSIALGQAAIVNFPASGYYEDDAGSRR